MSNYISMLNKPTRIVEKITNDINPEEVICTTYQMRNFYRQLGDGFFSGLDIMNLMQHYKAVEMISRGDVVLDVCCGRGLLLPLIRYYKKKIEEYIGVDISGKNIKEQIRRSGRKNIDGLNYYPFKITHIISNASEMSKRIDREVDFIIYTSSIEHMQKEDGVKSLAECYKLLKPGRKMFLSGPNTTNKRNPYDTQYAAHLYEWNANELSSECKKVGFKIEKIFGLYAKKRKFDSLMRNENNEIYQKFKEYIPTPFLMSFFPVIYPEYADEVLIILRKGE